MKLLGSLVEIRFRDQEIARKVKSLFEKYRLSTHTKRYTVLMSYPNREEPSKVEFLGSNGEPEHTVSGQSRISATLSLCVRIVLLLLFYFQAGVQGANDGAMVGSGGGLGGLETNQNTDIDYDKDVLYGNDYGGYFGGSGGSHLGPNMVAPYSPYSPKAVIESQIVYYANYGTMEDFEKLRELTQANFSAL